MSNIEIGTTFKRHGHPYEVVGFRPYTPRRGDEIELVRIAGACAVCHEPYSAMITRRVVRGSARHNSITRTCPEHRGMGPRWRRPPLLIDAAVAALADSPGAFMSARQLARATSRSASGMGNALSKAFHGQRGNAIKTDRGRLVRCRGRGHPTLFLLDTSRRHLARVKREALAVWQAAHVPQKASKPTKRIVTRLDAYRALGL
jgi:hypothetical protein